jgi:hypothetical protein
MTSRVPSGLLGCAIFGTVHKFSVFFGLFERFCVENTAVILFKINLLTIVFFSGYCGDGHSCPGD